MLTRADNELLTRVGPETPMGQMLREYWVPALRVQALEADGAPRRVRIMGENFVAFRAGDGRVGFFDEGCPHRCTSLALARNEDNALTCIFHGWKIDVSGRVMDVPSEPPERRAEFAAKVRVRHYPVREAGGIVWVYLGKREQPPRFMDFEFTHLPPDHYYIRKAVMHCNWFQGFEAVLDSAHAGILHSSWGARRAQMGILRNSIYNRTNTGPVFEFIATPYGFREGALRNLFDGTTYVRVREVVLPFFSFIPADPAVGNALLVAAIPIDDEWNTQWYIQYSPNRPLSQAQIDLFMMGTSGDPDNFCADMGNRDNTWHQDRQAMKEGHWTGVTRCVPYEDFIVEEAMGQVVDRSREYLGSSDAVIIRGRRMMLAAVREYQKGRPAFGLDTDFDYRALRGLALRVPTAVNWKELDPLNPPEAVPTQAPVIRQPG